MDIERSAIKFDLGLFFKDQSGVGLLKLTHSSFISFNHALLQVHSVDLTSREL